MHAAMDPWKKKKKKHLLRMPQSDRIQFVYSNRRPPVCSQELPGRSGATRILDFGVEEMQPRGYRTAPFYANLE